MVQYVLSGCKCICCFGLWVLDKEGIISLGLKNKMRECRYTKIWPNNFIYLTITNHSESKRKLENAGLMRKCIKVLMSSLIVILVAQ